MISGHERNEPLDCRNYALAAFKALAVDLDSIDRKLQASRGRVLPAVAQNAPKPAAAGRSKPKAGRGLSNYYDDW